MSLPQFEMNMPPIKTMLPTIWVARTCSKNEPTTVGYDLATFLNVFATPKNHLATKNVAMSFLRLARSF
jgi:hypothetical protein